MTDSRDDIVLSPELRLQSRPRRTAAHARRARLLGNVARTIRFGRIARRAASLAGGALLRAGAARVVPVVGLAALAGEAVYHGYRVFSGKSYGLIDAELNAFFLEGLDDDTRAAVQARHRIESDPDLLRIAGRQGGANHEIVRLYKATKEARLRQERGRSLFEQSPFFQSHEGLLDSFIERASGKVATGKGATALRLAADAVKGAHR